MNLSLVIKKIENSRWRYLLVFTAFLSIFLLFHSVVNGFSSNDDPYYHAKHSQLMIETGNFTLLAPWLEFHFLKYAPTDPWWGYHVLLAAPVYFFGPVWGSKVLTAVLAALAIVVFYGVLNNFRVQKPLFWTFLFFSSSAAFLQRLLLHRPHLLTIILLPLAYWLAARRKYYWLFVLSAVYTLLYQLAPIVMVIAAGSVVAAWHHDKRLDVKPLIASGLGLIAGVLLHPQGLNYVYVMFITFWRIMFLKFSGVSLNIGGELHAGSFLDFVRANLVVLGFYVSALAVGLAAWPSLKKQVGKNWLALAGLSLFWFIVPLLMFRGVEYFQPLAWLFIAVTISALMKLPEWGLFKQGLGRLRGGMTGFFAASALVIILLANVFLVFFGFIRDQSRAQDPFYFAQAAAWLKANTRPGEVVFYNNWGLWPMMFYYNDYNHYITGMDPTFLYEYDPKLFWLWRNISENGVYCDQSEPCLSISPRQGLALVAGAIKTKFRARFMLLNNNPDLPLFRTLQNRKQDFEQVYANDKVVIFKIK